MYDKSKLLKRTVIRINDGELKHIDAYAAMHEITRSEAIRELVRNGLSSKVNIELAERFLLNLGEKWLKIQPQITSIINQRDNLIFVRDTFLCQKCKRDHDLQVYNIDRDPLNTKPENLITLCIECAKKAEKYTPKRRVVEDFVEWFYLL